MKIWVDIANSPQVLFMCPIISELQRRGHELIITTRQHSETVLLADRYKLQHVVVGAHGGGTLIGKGASIILRASRLVMLLRRSKIAIAVSGSSFGQALAAKWMGLPFVSMADYEGNPGMHIICRTAKKILVPNVFSKTNLQQYGALDGQVEAYNGLKENIYLSGFIPDPLFLEKTGLPADKTIVTMRPASDVSAYHQFENPLFEEVLKYIAQHDDTFIVVLPRHARQHQQYAELELKNVFFPEHVLDGPNLIHNSDLVVGAGGTMNREAVVLGSPVYSLFMGMLGSVDRHLIEAGKMAWISNRADIQKIRVTRKNNSQSNFQTTSQNLIAEVVDKILDI